MLSKILREESPVSNALEKQREGALKDIVGKTIDVASSSLTNFVVGFADGSGVNFQAVEDNQTAFVLGSLITGELPEFADAVCSVDWSWIKGSTITEATATSGGVRLLLDKVGPLTIGSGFWEGKPFLSFRPYKPA